MSSRNERGEWLRTADVSAVVESVKTYGSITFIGNGLSDTQNADIAARAIEHQRKELVTLTTILASDKKVDDLYQSVTFEVGHSFGRLARIRRRIKYIAIAGLPPRDDQVDEGPLVPLSKAQAICDVLNIAEEPEG